MTTWWLIVVLFGGTDIPCTQENPKVGIWRRKDLTSLPRAPMICWQLQVSRVGMLFCLAFCNFTCFLLLLVPSRPPRSVAKNCRLFIWKTAALLSQSILPTWNIWQLMKQNVWNECPPVAEPRNTVIGGSQKVLCPSRHYWRTSDTQAITSEGRHVFEWTHTLLPSDTSLCNFLKNCAPDILWIPMGWGSAVWVYITSKQSVC